MGAIVELMGTPEATFAVEQAHAVCSGMIPFRER